MINRISYLIYIAAFLLAGCASHYSIHHAEVKPIDLIQATIEDDPAIARIIEPYKADLSQIMGEVLNTCEVAMERNLPEGLLGNFVADLSLYQGNKVYQPKDGIPIDLCVLNNGGLRTALPKGDITRGKLYELMPFENELLVLTLNSNTMNILLNYIANQGGVPVAGITATITNATLQNILVNGQPMQDRNYKVLTTDYLANGGDDMFFFEDAVQREALYLKLRDAIINHVETLGEPITSKLDGRLKYGE